MLLGRSAVPSQRTHSPSFPCFCSIRVICAPRTCWCTQQGDDAARSVRACVRAQAAMQSGGPFAKRTGRVMGARAAQSWAAAFISVRARCHCSAIFPCRRHNYTTRTALRTRGTDAARRERRMTTRCTRKQTTAGGTSFLTRSLKARRRASSVHKPAQEGPGENNGNRCLFPHTLLLPRHLDINYIGELKRKKKKCPRASRITLVGS